jgi:PilZ domain
MLEISDERSVIEAAWEAAAAKPHLSRAVARRFFEPKGPMRGHFDNRRSYHRYYMRGKALLVRGDATLAIYTKDISRQGICFLSPVQLFPKEAVLMQLPNGAEYQLQIARCRRDNDECYECGTRFALE